MFIQLFLFLFFTPLLLCKFPQTLQGSRITPIFLNKMDSNGVAMKVPPNSNNLFIYDLNTRLILSFNFETQEFNNPLAYSALNPWTLFHFTFLTSSKIVYNCDSQLKLGDILENKWDIKSITSPQVRNSSKPKPFIIKSSQSRNYKNFLVNLENDAIIIYDENLNHSAYNLTNSNYDFLLFPEKNKIVTIPLNNFGILTLWEFFEGSQKIRGISNFSHSSPVNAYGYVSEIVLLRLQNCTNMFIIINKKTVPCEVHWYNIDNPIFWKQSSLALIFTNYFILDKSILVGYDQTNICFINIHTLQEIFRVDFKNYTKFDFTRIETLPKSGVVNHTKFAILGLNGLLYLLDVNFDDLNFSLNKISKDEHDFEKIIYRDKMLRTQLPDKTYIYAKMFVYNNYQDVGLLMINNTVFDLKLFGNHLYVYSLVSVLERKENGFEKDILVFCNNVSICSTATLETNFTVTSNQFNVQCSKISPVYNYINENNVIPYIFCKNASIWTLYDNSFHKMSDFTFSTEINFFCQLNDFTSLVFVDVGDRIHRLTINSTTFSITDQILYSNITSKSSCINRLWDINNTNYVFANGGQNVYLISLLQTSNNATKFIYLGANNFNLISASKIGDMDHFFVEYSSLYVDKQGTFLNKNSRENFAIIENKPLTFFTTSQRSDTFYIEDVANLTTCPINTVRIKNSNMCYPSNCANGIIEDTYACSPTTQCPNTTYPIIMSTIDNSQIILCRDLKYSILGCVNPVFLNGKLTCLQCQPEWYLYNLREEMKVCVNSLMDPKFAAIDAIQSSDGTGQFNFLFYNL